MGKEKLFTVSNVVLALVLMLFLIGFAVTFTLNFRPLYYADITWLDIPFYSGLQEADIRANYDALIDYNSIFHGGPLVFPTLPMSDSGRIHFEEVKDIFVAIQVMAMVCFAAGAVGCVLKLRGRKAAFFKLAAIVSLAVPAVLGLLVALSWDTFFTMFHQLFFNNDYWIFDVATDPVITILPSAFFMHCAIMILALVVLGSGAMYLTYRLLGKRFAGK